MQVVRIMRICAEHHKREGRHMAAWAAEIVANVQCSSAYTAALQGLAGSTEGASCCALTGWCYQYVSRSELRTVTGE